MLATKTIVISCAGMGSRLGLGQTKALVDIDGKPLIIRQLEQLNDFEDIRIVVGFQAESVIHTVLAYRKDVLFVFNQDYRNTGTGGSVSVALPYANEYIVSLDGDLLVHPDDLDWFLHTDQEYIGGCTPYTDEPHYFQTEWKDGVEYATYFSSEQGTYEWTGLLQVRSSRLRPCRGHVYQMLEPILPLRAVKIRTREIDTINDYHQAVNWVKNGYKV